MRTWSLICVFVHSYQQHATNYGSRVPVDTAPGPVPVYRALKRLPVMPAVRTDSWISSLQEHSEVHHRAGTAAAAPPRNPQSLNHGHLSCTTTGKEHDLQNRDIDHQETYCNYGVSMVFQTVKTMEIGLCTTTRMITTLLMS